MAGTRIEFQDLCKTFNTAKKGATITALDNVTLTVEPGEILGVIGYSGAGKSTLVRMINGLDSPTSGALLLDGTNIVGMPEKQLWKLRRNIGIAPLIGGTHPINCSRILLITGADTLSCGLSGLY